MKYALLACLLALAAPALAADPDRGPPTAACPKGVLTLTAIRAIGNPPDDQVIAEEAAADPCTKIDMSEVPFGQLADKISVLAASGNAPDILSYDGPNTQSYAAAGMLLAFDPYLPAGFKDDIVTASLTEHSYKGKLYSPGTQQTTLAMFYNATLLDKLGIHPPQDLKAGWTWPQAMRAIHSCQQGTGDNVTIWGLAPSRFGTGQPGFVYRDLLFQRSAGDPKAPKDSSLYKTFFALSTDGKTAQGWLNTPEAVAGATFYKDMFNGAARVTPKAGLPTMFQDGHACFTLETSYFMADMAKANPSFKWGVTPMPYLHSPIVHTGSITLGVSSRSRHPAEAVKWVMDVSTGAIALEYTHREHVLPALKSVAAKLPELNQYPLSIFNQELVEWGYPRPPSPHFAQYDKIVTDALRDIAYGGNPKSRLDAAARTLQPILSH
jgi:ABC-type glycerol-3-phosphate transport system substrate-binding protein